MNYEVYGKQSVPLGSQYTGGVPQASVPGSVLFMFLSVAWRQNDRLFTRIKPADRSKLGYELICSGARSLWINRLVVASWIQQGHIWHCRTACWGLACWEGGFKCGRFCVDIWNLSCHEDDWAVEQAAWGSCGISALEAFQDPKKQSVDHRGLYSVLTILWAVRWTRWPPQGLFQHVLLNASNDGNYRFIILGTDVLSCFLFYIHVFPLISQDGNGDSCSSKCMGRTSFASGMVIRVQNLIVMNCLWKNLVWK